MNLYRRVAGPSQPVAIEIRVRGRVQGVGFRPTIRRYARELGLVGEVLNDAGGVLVRVGGYKATIAACIERMEREPPPLACIDHVETSAYVNALPETLALIETHVQRVRDKDRGSSLPYVEPLAMWNAILADVILRTPIPIISALFHTGLVKVIVAVTKKLACQQDSSTLRFVTVALSGGCFQNRILFEEVNRRLEIEGFNVLSHAQVPPNDGGLALGQAAIGAAHLINDNRERPGLCASGFPDGS